MDPWEHYRRVLELVEHGAAPKEDLDEARLWAQQAAEEDRRLRGLRADVRAGSLRAEDELLALLRERGLWKKLEHAAERAITSSPRTSRDPGWDLDRLKRLIAYHQEARAHRDPG